MRIDVHQHVWTVPLREALSHRSDLPLIREDHGLSTVHCCGEQPWVLDAAGEAAPKRTALLARDGVDAAIVAISSPIGIEALPREEALDLIDAHLTGVQEFGPRFGAWGPLVTDRPQSADIDHLAQRGCLGVSVPSGALAVPGQIAALGPVLERLAAHDLPLFIHPGRAHGDRPSHPSLEEPLWWRALNDYVFGMQSAWLSWVSAGRSEHPRLTVIFAMLAGLAPLQAERLRTRGGPPVDLADPRTFYDTSSYGSQAITALAGVVGESQLLYGSDRPVVEPLLTGANSTPKSNAGALFSATFGERGVAVDSTPTGTLPETPLAA